MSSASIIGTLLLTSSIFGFLPDGVNSEGLSEGELFLPPLSSNYNNGFSISYLRNDHEIIGDDNLLFLDLYKSFSTRRWYIRGNSIIEIGGAAGFKQYSLISDSFSDIQTIDKDDNELLVVGNDYIISNHIGFLTGNFVMRLSWNYENKQITGEFGEYLTDELNTEQAKVATEEDRMSEFIGDNLEFLIADIRPRARYYIGLGAFSTFNLGDRGKRFARVGFDYRGYERRGIRLVFGGEVSNFGFNGGDTNYRASIGMEKSETPVNGLRLTAVWEEGPSAYGPYHDVKVNHIGIKATRFF